MTLFDGFMAVESTTDIDYPVLHDGALEPEAERLPLVIGTKYACGIFSLSPSPVWSNEPRKCVDTHLGAERISPRHSEKQVFSKSTPPDLTLPGIFMDIAIFHQRMNSEAATAAGDGSSQRRVSDKVGSIFQNQAGVGKAPAN